MIRHVLSVVLLAGLAAATCAAWAGPRPAQVSLAFDLSAAEAQVALFDRNTVTREDVAALLDHPAVLAMIRQTARFDPAATEERFVESLWQALNGRAPDPDPFRFQTVRERLGEIRESLSLLTSRRAPFVAAIRERLAAYTPPGVEFETTLRGVVGGTSDGWAPGDGDFYVALHYFGSDVDGLTAMLAHETYHIAQRQFFFADAEQGAAQMLVANVVAEGTAVLASNPETYSGDGRYLRFLKDKHARNLARIRDSFVLFEALYAYAAAADDAPAEQLYSLGFSGTWDSPLYFVGFRVAEALEKHRGRPALLRLLAAEPGVRLLDEYIRVYEENDDPELVRFSAATERRIRNALTRR